AWAAAPLEHQGKSFWVNPLYPTIGFHSVPFMGAKSGSCSKRTENIFGVRARQAKAHEEVDHFLFLGLKHPVFTKSGEGHHGASDHSLARSLFLGLKHPVFTQNGQRHHGASDHSLARRKCMFEVAFFTTECDPGPRGIAARHRVVTEDLDQTAEP